MVESLPKTQLPTTTTQEESKEEVSWMCGSDPEDMIEDIKERLGHVELNLLEEGLIRKHIKEGEGFETKVLQVLERLANRHNKEDHSLRKIEKVSNLFKEHEFWSH